MLAVAVERSPVEVAGPFTFGGAPVKRRCVTLVFHLESAALMGKRQADHQRPDLGRRARRVDVRFELASGSRVYLEAALAGPQQRRTPTEERTWGRAFSLYSSTFTSRLCFACRSPGSRYCAMVLTMPTSYGLKLVRNWPASILPALRYDSSNSSRLPTPKVAGAMSAMSLPRFCSVSGSSGNRSSVKSRAPSLLVPRQMRLMGRQCVERKFSGLRCVRSSVRGCFSTKRFAMPGKPQSPCVVVGSSFLGLSPWPSKGSGRVWTMGIAPDRANVKDFVSFATSSRTSLKALLSLILVGGA